MVSLRNSYITGWRYIKASYTRLTDHHPFTLTTQYF